MKKILLGYKFRPDAFSELEKDFELVYPEREYFSRDELLKILPQFDVLVPSFKFQIDKEVIDAGKNLKLIANFGVGYNNIDVDYAAAKGIAVTNTPHSVTEPTAELTFALLLAAARRIGFNDRHLRTPEGVSWKLYDNLGVSVYGKTLGIVGMGRIGQAIARRAIASGMKVIYHNRKPLDKNIEEKYAANYVSFEELLKESDFISLNAPATEDTFHLIGKDELAKMKSSAIIINAARGSLIDENALVEALKGHAILGAGLDVYEREPKITPELKELDNIVLSPHAGTQTIEAREDMQREVARNIIGYFKGETISKVN